jgi:Polysaccharide pyruvyl transferase
LRVLVTGWASFTHGEATAGDVLAMEAVRSALQDRGIACDLAWSRVFRPTGRALADCAPEDYTHLVFTCGPVHGALVAGLHERYRACYRLAVGVSVIDPTEPAAAGFHAIYPRDAADGAAQIDLAATVPFAPAPVAAVILANDQPEYGARGRHGQVGEVLAGWLATVDCARVFLDTRLAYRNWRSPASAAHVESVIARADVVVTTRLHGLVLALKNGVPTLAVDPVAGGAKVAAQSAAWRWPVLVARGADPVLDAGDLEYLWAWCRSPEGIARARAAAATVLDLAATCPAQITQLLRGLTRQPLLRPPG